VLQLAFSFWLRWSLFVVGEDVSCCYGDGDLHSNQPKQSFSLFSPPSSTSAEKKISSSSFLSPLSDSSQFFSVLSIFHFRF